jgi:hypothetical protein
MIVGGGLEGGGGLYVYFRELITTTLQRFH